MEPGQLVIMSGILRLITTPAPADGPARHPLTTLEGRITNFSLSLYLPLKLALFFVSF